MNNNIYLYWVGYEYKLIKKLRELIYLHSKSSYNVHLITRENLSDYLDDIPSYFDSLLPAHQADYIRVCVICERGGIWLDSDTIVMDNLSSLFSLFDKYDGFFIKENNDYLWNGVFGSKPNTKLMNVWKKNIIDILNEKSNKIEWTEIGTRVLEKNKVFLDNYKIFSGLDNMYSINWNNCVNEFIIKPYENYKNIIREYQPLIVLVNTVYKEYDKLSDDQISKTPLSYFLNKSKENYERRNTFDSIYLNKIWNSGNNNIPLSGPGSSLDNTKEIINLLDTFIYDNKIMSVLDLGCGDLTWMPSTKFFNDNTIKYTGCDIVSSLIVQHLIKYPNKKFLNKDIVTSTDYEFFDLIIIRDVIFHLKNEDILNIFNNIKNKFKYIAITSCMNQENSNKINIYNFSEKNINIEPFNISKLYLKNIYENKFNRNFFIYNHNNFYNFNNDFSLANEQFKNNKFEEAIINYKKVLQNSKSNDEKYISCLRIHESFHKLNKEQDGIYYLIESFKYDEKRIECIYKLIVFYNIMGNPNISLSFYSLIQDFFENEFINDSENIFKKLEVNKHEYIFYLPYFMVIVAYKLNKPKIAIKMFEIIFKFKFIDSGEWYLNNLFYNFNLFINNIDLIKENLFKEFETYLNLIYVNKRYKLDLIKLNTICNSGINFGLNYKNIKYLNNNKLKILFHMSDNRPIKKYTNISDSLYNGLAAVINYEYCKKFGYDFKYYIPFLNQLEPLNLHNCLDPNNNQPRHASWSKLLATKLALDSEENYDYIVYLDSDCIVKNFDIPLESVIYGYENKSMIFFWDLPCTPNEPNAGVYICKNNLNTKLMIQEWYNVNVSWQNINRIWEQTALWQIYKEWQKKDLNNLVILENINMAEKENQYLRHITTGESRYRVNYFKDIIERKKINYTENLENIIEIQFDTNLLYSKKIKNSRMYIFLPYYGSFPNYFQLYLDSLSINNDILTVFIITDIDTSNYKIPKNAIIINMKLQEIRERFALFLKNEYSMNINVNELLTSNYKLCDIKIIYPILFNDVIEKYNISKNDYVGWGDCDVIYGKLSNIINLFVNNYEIIGGYNGHFTVLLNNDNIKNLYKRIPEYNNMCIDKESKFCDEHGGFLHILQNNNFNIFIMKDYMNDILPDCMFHRKRPDHSNQSKFLNLHYPLIDIKYLYFDKEKQKLITVYIDGKETENTYCHLQKRKMEIKFDKYDNIFYINQYSFTKEILV